MANEQEIAAKAIWACLRDEPDENVLALEEQEDSFEALFRAHTSDFERSD